RMAWSNFGSAKTPAELQAIAALADRPARQRTTLYGRVETETLPDEGSRAAACAVSGLHV
ncbi:MAG: hypothetical protein ACYCO3_03280, partial [Mycobacteriales bacterium]